MWLTYKHDYDLSATDTLYCWTVMTTVRNGSLADLEAQVAYAKSWFMTSVNPCCADDGCCMEKVGNANGLGGEVPTIGDISVMIDAKFVAGTCILYGSGCNIVCLEEADMNLSGGANATCDDITIGDISMLIDCLFITGEPPYVRNNCAIGCR